VFIHDWSLMSHSLIVLSYEPEKNKSLWLSYGKVFMQFTAPVCPFKIYTAKWIKNT